MRNQSSQVCRFENCVSVCSLKKNQQLTFDTIDDNFTLHLLKIMTELRAGFQVNDTEVFNWNKFTALELLRSRA